MKQRVIILGSGESGMGAAKLAASKGHWVFLSDGGVISAFNKSLLDEWGVGFEEKHHTESIILTADLIVKSPGIPDNVPIVKSALKSNIPVISEIEFAYRYMPEKAKLIAITGTNGKTTTTLLTYHLLKSAEFHVALGGNVGISLAGILCDAPYDYYVVEVSSFQLDGIVKFKPDVAVLLNITPDHLDRYEYDFQKYVNSKFKITENLTHDECFIYCADSLPITEELARRNTQSGLFAISAASKISNGAYLGGDQLMFDYKIKGKDASHQIPISEINLIGRHNLLNTMAAVLSALVMDVPLDQVIKGLRSFTNAPHRLEPVGDVNGVKYINDSKATNVDSVYYALEGIDRPIVWIVGGIDKGNDYSAIAPFVREKVHTIIAMGLKNDPIKQFFSGMIGTIIETRSMKETVMAAFHAARPGDVVLLSPACASFDLFKNYEDRGDQFRAEVQQLKKKEEAIV